MSFYSDAHWVIFICSDARWEFQGATMLIFIGSNAHWGPQLWFPMIFLFVPMHIG